MYLISGALRLLFVQYAKGRVKKFMLGKLVDFSIKWVAGLWILMGSVAIQDIAESSHSIVW